MQAERTIKRNDTGSKSFQNAPFFLNKHMVERLGPVWSRESDLPEWRVRFKKDLFSALTALSLLAVI